MAANQPKAELPAWKLIETIAMVTLAVLARGAARIIDDHAVVLSLRTSRLRWGQPFRADSNASGTR